VFGCTITIRELWMKILQQSPEGLNQHDANCFIDKLLIPCLNLLNPRDPRNAHSCMTEVLEWICSILSRGSDWTDTQQHYKVSRLQSSQFMLYFGLSVSHCFTQPPTIHSKKKAPFTQAVKKLQTAHERCLKEEKEPWIKSRGKGIVCIRDSGINNKTFVDYYWGKL
jgi:hypothetical protein